MQSCIICTTKTAQFFMWNTSARKAAGLLTEQFCTLCTWTKAVHILFSDLFFWWTTWIIQAEYLLFWKLLGKITPKSLAFIICLASKIERLIVEINIWQSTALVEPHMISMERLIGLAGTVVRPTLCPAPPHHRAACCTSFGCRACTHF